MNDILLPALIIGGIGLVLGLILAVAAIIFKVDQDERVPKIIEVLPGANCGGCGFAGCAAYAQAVVEGKAAPGGCPVGGTGCAALVSEIMGVKAEFTPRRAVVLCCGTCDAAGQKYEYEGLGDCAMAEKLAHGPKACNYGCMGLGSCVRACKFDALSIKNGIATVNEAKCTACGACVAACPKNIIQLVPKDKKVVVACKSNDKGGAMKSLCTAGCIGCKICEKSCPVQAISVSDNHAVINYEKCIGCKICVEKCPKKVIHVLA